MEDPLREIRTMVLSSFSCPPLPQLAHREAAGATDVVSSHDTIACAMQGSNQAFTAELEDARVRLQMRCLAEYNAELDRLYLQYCAARSGAQSEEQRRGVVDLAYAAMQHFTRCTIGSYLLSTELRVDARFTPLDDVCVGDTVHQRAVEYLVANRIVVGSNLLTAEDLKGLSYRALIERFFVLYSEDGIAERQG